MWWGVDSSSISSEDSSGESSGDDSPPSKTNPCSDQQYPTSEYEDDCSHEYDQNAEETVFNSNFAETSNLVNRTKFTSAVTPLQEEINSLLDDLIANHKPGLEKFCSRQTLKLQQLYQSHYDGKNTQKILHNGIPLFHSPNQTHLTYYSNTLTEAYSESVTIKKCICVIYIAVIYVTANFASKHSWTCKYLNVFLVLV